jgi:hypothetical protein
LVSVGKSYSRRGVGNTLLLSNSVDDVSASAVGECGNVGQELSAIIVAAADRC